MQKRQNHSWITSLHDVVQHFSQLKQLLNLDKEYYGKNDLAKITVSNNEKNAAIAKISILVNELRNDSTTNENNLFETLEQRAASLDSSLRAECHAAISELKSELTECYQLIAINSKVVYTTMQHVKSIWDKLLHYKNDMDCVYNHKGSTGK